MSVVVGIPILRLAVWRNVAVFLATHAPGARYTSNLLQTVALGAPGTWIVVVGA